MKTLSKKTKQKKKKLKTASGSDDLKIFLNQIVEVQFKMPMLDTTVGIPIAGVAGVLMKLTKKSLYIGENNQVTSIIARDVVGMVNKATSVHPGLAGVPIPEDPNRGH